MMKLAASAVTVLAVAGWVSSVSAQNRLFVEITEGTAAPLAIAVPEIASGFGLDEASVSDIGIELAQIVRADLGTSPYFRIMGSTRPSSSDDRALVRELSATGAQGLVIGRPTLAADGTLRYACSFFDIFSGVREASEDIVVPRGQWRRAAHKCADMVYAHTTGYQGHFDTRFVGTTLVGDGPDTGWIVSAFDFDGENPQILAQAESLLAMPQQSRNGRSLLYVAYQGDVPRLAFVNMVSGSRSILQLPAGLPSAARFSPDGASIAFALSRNGNTDIFEYRLATGVVTQLTDTTGIDTAPDYSPDGTSIVFESDRSGQSQIYVMRRDGSDQRRITFGEAHGSPTWSRDGANIAYVRYLSNGSRIRVSAPDGSRGRYVSSGPFDEDPSWARSNRAIAFQRTGPGTAAPALWIADLGGREFQVGLGHPVSEPQWSEVAE